MVRIVFLSDMHNRHRGLTIPDGDIIVCAGDFTENGTQIEMEEFFRWWSKLPHLYKVLVAGNHDISLDNSKYSNNSIRPFWVTYMLSQYLIQDHLNFYLEHSSCNIWGIKFFGSPYSPKINPGQKTKWGFSLEREDLGRYWVDIPENTNILITHCPPYGILDHTFLGANPGNIGCERLRYHVHRVKPRIHLFGHVHEGYGLYRTEHTLFCNGSVLDLQRNPANAPQIIDYNENTGEFQYVFSEHDLNKDTMKIVDKIITR